MHTHTHTHTHMCKMMASAKKLAIKCLHKINEPIYGCSISLFKHTTSPYYLPP